MPWYEPCLATRRQSFDPMNGWEPCYTMVVISLITREGTLKTITTPFLLVSSPISYGPRSCCGAVRGNHVQGKTTLAGGHFSKSWTNDIRTRTKNPEWFHVISLDWLQVKECRKVWHGLFAQLDSHMGKIVRPATFLETPQSFQWRSYYCNPVPPWSK